MSPPAVPRTRSNRDSDPWTDDDPNDAIGSLAQRAALILLELSGGDGSEGELLDELADVHRALVALLETVDPSAAADAIDLERLWTLVDWTGIPRAVSTGDYRSALAYENLPEVVDAADFLESTDIREGWRRARELSTEVEDVTDALSGDDGGAESGTVEENRVEAANDAAEREAGVELAKSLSTTDGGRRLVVQKAVSDAVSEVRADLLDAHERIETAVADHESRSARVDRPNSRNPSAFSTLPRSGPPVAAATTFSTVPTETRYSDAPNFERVYGRRFQRFERRE